MEQAKVFFTSFKATEHENLLQKLHRLMSTLVTGPPMARRGFFFFGWRGWEGAPLE